MTFNSDSAIFQIQFILRRKYLYSRLYKILDSLNIPLVLIVNIYGFTLTCYAAQLWVVREGHIKEGMGASSGSLYGKHGVEVIRSQTKPHRDIIILLLK